MDYQERFAFYSNPVYATEVATSKGYLIGASNPRDLKIYSEGFKEDDRNIGGKDAISDQHLKHKVALRKITSVIADQQKPPHCHITKVVGEKTDFGRGRKPRRHSHKPYAAQPILTRKMRNINSELHQHENFGEIKETFRRVKEIQAGKTYLHYGSSVNNTKPYSFKLAKKIAENRRPNQFAATEHVKNLASLSRRLNSLNNLQMRKKNPFDPVVFPTKVRRPGAVPQDSRAKGLDKRISRQDRRKKEHIERLEKRIVCRALSAAGSPGKSISPTRFSIQELRSDNMHSSGQKRPDSFSCDNLYPEIPQSYTSQIQSNPMHEGEPLLDGEQLQSEPCLKQVQAQPSGQLHVPLLKQGSAFKSDIRCLRTVSHTFDTISNKKTATTRAQPELSISQEASKLQSSSSLHTTAANGGKKRPWTGFKIHRSNEFYNTSRAAFTTTQAQPSHQQQQTVDPMLNIAISSQSLANQQTGQAAQTQQDLAMIGLPPRSTKAKKLRGSSAIYHRKSRQAGKAAYMSDFAILNRVRIRRNQFTSREFNEDVNNLTIMTPHGTQQMPHALVSPQFLAPQSTTTAGGGGPSLKSMSLTQPLISSQNDSSI